MIEREAFVDVTEELPCCTVVCMWYWSRELFDKFFSIFSAVRIGSTLEGDGLVGILRSAFSR